MPAPHDPIRIVQHGDNGISLFNGIMFYPEFQTVAFDLYARYQIGAILPDEQGIFGRAMVVNIRGCNGTAEVVHQCLEDIYPPVSSAVSRSIVVWCIRNFRRVDSISVDQRQGIFTGSIDDIAVGSIQDLRRPCRIGEVVGCIARSVDPLFIKCPRLYIGITL